MNVELSTARDAFEDHVGRSLFQQGIDERRWSIEDVDWPHVVVRIFASTGKVALRFDLSDYPTQAPTATPWCVETLQVLPVEKWPTGTRASEVFARAWAKENQFALYLPLDRVAASSHPNWETDYPGYVWDSSKTILDYVLVVSQTLQGAQFP